MLSVLYVDDEANLLEITKLYLELRGEFSVDTKISAQDGLDALMNKAYNAVVSDFQMPGINGIEFLKIVRSKFGDLPFILFTGRGREDVVIQAIDTGVDFYIQKGEDARSQLAELEHKIRMAVQRNNSEQARINYNQWAYDLFTFLPDATFAIDKQGIIIAWNKAIEEMTGISAIDMLGKDNYEYALPLYGERCPILIDLVFNSDADIENRYSRLLKEEGNVMRAETRFTKLMGLSRILSCKVSPIQDNKGNIVGAIESICDITPQRTAEKALQESEVRLQRAEMIAHFGHWQLDLDSGTMICSDGAGAIYGTKNLLISTKAAQQITLPEYRQALDETLQSLITQGKPYNLEYKIQRVNDWAVRDIHSVAAYDAEHRVVFGVIQDITERKQIELSLRAMNDQLPTTRDELRDLWQKIEEITAMVPGVIFQYYIRPNGERGVHFVNEHAAEIIFGFDNSNKDFFRWFTGHVHPDDRDRFIESVNDSQKKAESWNFEGRFVKPSGETIWFCSKVSPVVHGNELVYSGVLLDITERKTAEKMLLDSEEKFRSLVKHSPEAILIIDLEGMILFANDAAVRTIEANDYDSLVGRKVIDFIAPESREDAARDLMQLSQGHDACLAHYSIISAQGKKIHVESIGKAIVYKGKTADLLSIRNITERELVEDTLLEREQLLLPFNNTDDGLALHEIIFDGNKKVSDYRILEVNGSFERQLGISRTSVIGKTSREAYNTTEPQNLDVYARVADTGKPETFETYFPSLQKYFRISVYSPKKNQFATVFSDITERKLVEEALRQANIRLNLMTSITRHDILNKVSALIGYLGILRMKFPNPALAHYISELEDTSIAIQCLITDTQTYQNIGISEPKWQEPDKLIRYLRIPDSITLTVDLRGVELYADPMLEKVFFNLLDNSIRHGQKVTEIKVSSRQSNEGLVVVWEDNGSGIPDDEKDKIFEKGFGKNTGLGLFLCREILTITGMTMRETGELGKGARFEIIVPKCACRLS